ncbi:hypothetical protein MTO96_020245 [Rhipicephalus appendiculatus]
MKQRGLASTGNLCRTDIRDLDLTNCILHEPNELRQHIDTYVELRTLRCVACALRPADLLRLILERLRCLVRVEFSLVAYTGVFTEIRDVREIASQMPNALAVSLRSMYVEVGGSPNFKILRALLEFCPNLVDLHVHFVRGAFWDALLEGRGILEERALLDIFKFTSEVPAAIQREPALPLEYASCAAVCGSVTYQRSSDLWNCVHLRDLGTGTSRGRILPSQIIVVGVHIPELTTQWIRRASCRHDWTTVRELCLLLFPAEPSSIVYPQVGESYRASLRVFFREVLQNIVELNISSFHFGPDLDLTEFLAEGILTLMVALSAPQCGLRHPSALCRLALYCPFLEDLDVRIHNQGSFIMCTVCESDLCLAPENVADLHASAPSHCNGLARLTLSEVPKLASLRFLERCQVATLRLSNCLGPSHPDYERLGQLLTSNSTLRCLVFRDTAMPFKTPSFQANLAHAQSLRYLCLLSETSASEDEASTAVRVLSESLPHLQYLHVHYRDASAGTERRVTWMQQDSVEGGSVRSGTMFQDRPCLLYCSTATFIGLTKPVNRDYKSFL